MNKLNRSMGVISAAAALVVARQWLPAQVPPATTPIAPTTMPVLPTTWPAMIDAATPAPSSEPSPATAPTTAPVRLGPRAPAGQISLNFKDAAVDTVLDHLSEVAGFIVLKDGPITGRVTVMSKQPVSPDEAVALLNSVLKGNGFTAIQMGRVLKIVALDKARKSAIPVRYGADPKTIPQTDELVTQVIPLKTMDAVKLKADIQPLIGTEADLASNASANALIMTDTSANIRRVVEIVSNLDKRDVLENTIHVKQLKYADATAAAKLITDIFKTDQQQGQSAVQGPAAFFRAMQQGRGGGGGRGGAGGDSASTDSGEGRQGKVTASADSRTNTVVVTGPADRLQVIDTVLEQLDSNPTSEQTFFHYPLRNGQSAKIAATLNSLFGGSTSGNSSGSSNTRSTTGTNRTTGSGSTSAFGGSNNSRTGGSSGAFGSTGGAFGNTNTASRSGFNGGVAGGAGSGGAGAGAMTDLYGQVYVVADADTNSLLVATATKHEKRVREMIAQLDRAVPQVLIKVLIAEVTHENTNDLGVDFSILNTRNGGSNGQTGGTDFGTAAATGGLKVSVLEPHVTATLRALSSEGKLDVLSRPYILASDNQLATITVGQEVPFITNSRITDTGGTINTVQYQDIGIILNVTPHINPDGLVILDVAPEISSLTGTTVPIQAGVEAPVFAKRSADSRVGIPNGQTIVIGGLMEDKKTSTIRKVPILGDIPILSLLFKRTEVTKSKTELLIFLTPHVAAQPTNLRPMSQDEMGGLKLTPNAVQPGTLEEHLDGLQRGKTSPDPDSSLTIPPTAPAKPNAVDPKLPGTK